MAVGAASGGRTRSARAVEIPSKACSLRSALFVGACPFSRCSAVRTMPRVAAASRFAAPRPERFASPTRSTAAKKKKEGGEFAAGRSADPRAAAIHAVVLVVGQAASVPVAIGASAGAATAEAEAAAAAAAAGAEAAAATASAEREAGAADAVPAEPLRIFLCPCRCKGSPDKPPSESRPNARGSSPSIIAQQRSAPRSARAGRRLAGRV